MGHEEADVGEQRTGLEVLAGGLVEPVQRGQPVEQLDGEAGDVSRVRRVVVAPLGELADAAPRHVAEVVQRPVDTHPPDGVDEHAVTQRGLAERDPLDAERRRHRLQDQRAGGGDVGAAGLQAGDLGPG